MHKVISANGKSLDLVEALLDMGMRTNDDQVSEAMKMLFPKGNVGVDVTTILVEVFSHIEGKRRRRILDELSPETSSRIAPLTPVNDDFAI